MESIRVDLLGIDIPLRLRIPTGRLLYIKLWADFLHTYSVNVDVSVAASAPSSAGDEPAYTYSLDLEQAVSSTMDVDVKSGRWSPLRPALADDIQFQARAAAPSSVPDDLGADMTRGRAALADRVADTRFQARGHPVHIAGCLRA